MVISGLNLTMPFSQKSFHVVAQTASSILTQSCPSSDSNHPWISLRYYLSSLFFFFFFTTKPLSFRQPRFPCRLLFLIFKPSCLFCFQLITELWSDTSKGTSSLQQVILPCVLFPSYCLASLFFAPLHLQLPLCSSPGHKSVLQECTYHV